MSSTSPRVIILTPHIQLQPFRTTTTTYSSLHRTRPRKIDFTNSRASPAVPAFLSLKRCSSLDTAFRREGLLFYQQHYLTHTLARWPPSTRHSRRFPPATSPIHPSTTWPPFSAIPSNLLRQSSNPSPSQLRVPDSQLAPARAQHRQLPTPPRSPPHLHAPRRRRLRLRPCRKNGSQSSWARRRTLWG